MTLLWDGDVLRSKTRDLRRTAQVMDRGIILEQNSPKEFFANPKEERTKEFLSKVL